MSQSQIVIPDADEQLKRMLVEERELASAIDAAKEKMKPIKDRHAQLQKSMLSWAKQHHTTIGVEVHVTQVSCARAGAQSYSF